MLSRIVRALVVLIVLAGSARAQNGVFAGNFGVAPKVSFDIVLVLSYKDPTQRMQDFPLDPMKQIYIGSMVSAMLTVKRKGEAKDAPAGSFRIVTEVAGSHTEAKMDTRMPFGQETSTVSAMANQQGTIPIKAAVYAGSKTVFEKALTVRVVSPPVKVVDLVKNIVLPTTKPTAPVAPSQPTQLTGGTMNFQLGGRRIAVPEVRRLPVTMALAAIRNAGFSKAATFDITSKPVTATNQGTVDEQNLAPGTMAPVDAEIKLKAYPLLKP